MPTPPRKKKPSFDLPASPAATPASEPAGWVYKSGAAAPADAGAAPVTSDAGPAKAVPGPAVQAGADPAPAEAGRQVRTGGTGQDARAFEIVKWYSLYAAGAGLVPVPAVDIAAIAVIELKMVRALAEVYGVPFAKDRVRPIIAALIGGYGSTKLGYGAGGALLKALPFIGPLVGAVAVPGFGAGVTWAIGRVFIQHFASGGTFLNFDLDQAHRYAARTQASA